MQLMGIMMNVCLEKKRGRGKKKKKTQVLN